MISLYDLLEAANGQLFGEPRAQLFTGFCLDSRTAQDSQIFVARKTDYGDTHQYIREAVERGASGVLCTRPPDFDTDQLSVIIVKDTEAAMMAWATYVLAKLRPRVIGVTGTAGKSVTVEAIERVLATRYRVHKSTVEYRGRLRLPLSLAGLRAEHDMVVLELGTWQPGEIAEMVQTVRPDIGVVTQIGYAHTDTFSDLDHIAQEERILLTHLPKSGLAVLNYDDDRVRGMASYTPAPVMTVGCNFGADLMAYNIVIGDTKTGFDLRYAQERYVGRWTPLISRQHLYCALFALGVGVYFEVPLNEGLQALTELEPLPGRMKPLRGINNSLLIDDSYDATPQSAEAALEWLRAVRDGTSSRTIFVMGDMDNLGPYSQRGHRMVAQAAVPVADVIITQGPQAAQVARAAIDYGKDRRAVHLSYSLSDVVTLFRTRLQLTENDIVLVKGGAGARMEMLVKALLADEQDTQYLARQGENWDLQTLNQPATTTWVEIDQGAIAHNVQQIKQMIGERVRLMAVVKADAYGHGAVAVSTTALANGAEALGVATFEEALELRDAGLDAPILVLSYTPVYAVRQAIRQDVTLTLYDLDMAQAYNRAAREMNTPLKVHVKIDTGMGRLGLLPTEAIPFFRHLINLQFLDIEGIYTHFSMADEDPDYTREQIRRFRGIVNPLRASGFQFRYVHTANSAAVLTVPESYFDMVRVGMALFGQSPSDRVPIPPHFRPAFTWKSVIAQVKTLPPGQPVGYGQTYYTTGYERIAVIPVGYSHGFRRKPHNWGQVLVHGQFAPIVGRVSMEKTTINVTHIPDVTIGDEVVLLGQQGANVITPDDVAARLGTNNYEVITTALARVPRR
jgi:alanine racemase